MSQPSQPVPPINPYDSPEMARPGMSGTAKLLIGLGIGCGVLVLICCGVGGITLFYFGNSLSNAVSEDPATVRQVAQSIVTIEIPAELEPKMSLDWTVPIVGVRGAMAVFASNDKHSALVLFQMDKNIGADASVMKAQFDQALRENNNQHSGEVVVEDPEPFAAEINGSQANFTIGKGKRPEGREVWQATGGFEGKGGPAMILVQLDAEKFSKEQLLDVLKSMK